MHTPSSSAPLREVYSMDSILDEAYKRGNKASLSAYLDVLLRANPKGGAKVTDTGNEYSGKHETECLH